MNLGEHTMADSTNVATQSRSQTPEGRRLLPTMVQIASGMGGLAKDVATSPITKGLVTKIGGIAKDLITSQAAVSAAKSAGNWRRILLRRWLERRSRRQTV